MIMMISRLCKLQSRVARNRYCFSSAGVPGGMLKGVRVLDLSRILAGPYGTMQLSDLGAEVIKVESFEGDETRKWGPPFTTLTPESKAMNIQADSAYFLSANRNKKSICVNLKTNEGVDLLKQLAKHSDVLTENFSRGVMDKYGLGFEDLHKLNQRLIYASISGYGEHGPLANAPAFDLVMQARSGFMHITGHPDSPPTKMGFAITDVLTGLNLANGILAALFHRSQTGRGMHVTTSLQESSVASIVNVSSQYLNGGLCSSRMGNNHPSIVPYGVYQAKNNEYVVIGAATNDQFKRFCQVIGKPAIADEERFKQNKDRVRNRVELDAIILDSLKDLDAKWLTKEMELKKIPGGFIMNVQQLFDDEQVKHLKLAEDVPSKNYENLKLVRNPINYSEDIKAQMKEPPLLNQHCDEILRDVLNLSESDIQNLREKNAIK